MGRWVTTNQQREQDGIEIARAEASINRKEKHVARSKKELATMNVEYTEQEKNLAEAQREVDRLMNRATTNPKNDEVFRKKVIRRMADTKYAKMADLSIDSKKREALLTEAFEIPVAHREDWLERTLPLKSA